MYAILLTLASANAGRRGILGILVIQLWVAAASSMRTAGSLTQAHETKVKHQPSSTYSLDQCVSSNT